MTALLGLGLLGATILASAVCTLYILWILDRENGRAHALLGFFFPPYAYFWAWWNARRLGLTPLVLLWTVLVTVSVGLALILGVNL